MPGANFESDDGPDRWNHLGCAGLARQYQQGHIINGRSQFALLDPCWEFSTALALQAKKERAPVAAEYCLTQYHALHTKQRREHDAHRLSAAESPVCATHRSREEAAS